MDTSDLKKNPIWFVTGAYTVGGTPKAEDATMTYARAKYLNALIPGYMIPEVIKDIKGYRDRLLQENRRLKTVYVSFCDGYTGYNCNIRIGCQSLHLSRVNKVIE